MGAGKSTIGRKLAQRLGLSFVDCDEVIEQRTGTTIPIIFEIEGESGFREREEKILAELLQGENQVIATGGGCVTREVNRQNLQQAGAIIIYLATSVTEQLKRTRRSRNRPLLNTDNREKKLLQLAEEREPIYSNLATHTIRSQGRKVNTVVDEIVEALGIDNR